LWRKWGTALGTAAEEALREPAGVGIPAAAKARLTAERRRAALVLPQQGLDERWERNSGCPAQIAHRAGTLLGGHRRGNAGLSAATGSLRARGSAWLALLARLGAGGVGG
jgi:hypothetical protein